MTLQLTTAIDRRGWRASYAKAYKRSRTYKRARARKLRRDALLFALLVCAALAVAAVQSALSPGV